MTVSRENRDQDLDDAIRMMMAELGDGWFALLFVNGDKAPYDKVLSTTWRELTRRGFVKDRGLKRLDFTSRGWLYGVMLLDLQNEPTFRENMSKLLATLKGYVRELGRQQDALVDIYQVSRDSGVSEDFVRNAISSKLLDQCFNLRGAYFPPEDQMQHVLVVPLDYGHEP